MDNVICVTGQMAAGKNFYCKQLEAQGWHALDADILVHKAIDIAKDKILDTFGPYAAKQNLKLQREEDGSIDRRALGQLLFSMPSLLEIQESIVYAIITKQIQDYIEENPNQKIIINATLLYKTPELMKLCSKIIFVKAPFTVRLQRAKKRDNLPTVQILKRFNRQKGLYRNYKKTGVPIEVVFNGKNQQ